MEANELRIGNYVFEKGKIKKISSISGSNAKDYSKTTAIPLTEEWLFKFFPNGGANAAYLFDSEIGGIWIEKFLDNKYYVTDDEAKKLSFKEIEHVHQLQNLYHCLCGEELTINK